jgi:hypothetical protein
MESLIHAALYFLAGMFGAGLAVYVNKKFENRAMKEDITELTRIVEDIKAQISNEHREWEIKKDVAWETSEKLAVLVAAVAEVSTSMVAYLHHPEDSKRSENAKTARQTFDDTHALFGTTRFRVKLAFGKEINTALQRVEKQIKDLRWFTRGTEESMVLLQYSEALVAVESFLKLLGSDIFQSPK